MLQVCAGIHGQEAGVGGSARASERSVAVSVFHAYCGAQTAMCADCCHTKIPHSLWVRSSVCAVAVPTSRADNGHINLMSRAGPLCTTLLTLQLQARGGLMTERTLRVRHYPACAHFVREGDPRLLLASEQQTHTTDPRGLRKHLPHHGFLASGDEALRGS